MSILFHHYKELKEYISEVERIGAKVNSRKKIGWLTKKEEEQKQEEKEVSCSDLAVDFNLYILY